MRNPDQIIADLKVYKRRIEEERLKERHMGEAKILAGQKEMEARRTIGEINCHIEELWREMRELVEAK